MERLKIEEKIIVNSNQVNKMVEEVFSNVKAHAYLRKLGIDDETIKNNIDKIYDFACDMNNCKNCKGIAHCSKEPKFLVTSIEYKNGFVDRNIVPCKKYLEYVSFRNKFVRYDFPEEWLNNKIGTDVANIRSIAAQAVLKKYKAAISKESSKWIFLKGDIASGKSFFAATLLADAGRTNSFNSLAFIDVPSRFKELSDLAFQKNPLFNSEIEKYQKVECLVLDDFGNEFKSDFVRDNILFPILSFRIKEKLFTIITSNYSIEDCASMYQTNMASKPKIEQLRSMLKMVCEKEITLLSPEVR